MDEIYCLKFVIACCEQSIKEVLKVEGNFSLELFGVLLKKNVYESLEGDDWGENVEGMVERMSINYDFVDDLESDENLQQKIELDFDVIKGLTDEERERLVESIDLDTLMDKSEEVELVIDIPISSIVGELRRMMDAGTLELDTNSREILRDINLMDEIWESWNPYDRFMILSKQMVEYMLDNITL